MQLTTYRNKTWFHLAASIYTFLFKEIDDTTIKDTKNLFTRKKENEAIKERIIRDIRNLFEHKEGDCYKPVRAGNFWSNNYIDPESNSDTNKTISIEVYLNKVWSCLKDIINNLKKSDALNFQLTIEINFISSKGNDEERVMHSKSNNIEFLIFNNVDKVTEELFESPFIDKKCWQSNQK